MAGTLKDQFCRLSPFGPAVTPAMRNQVARAQEQLLNGSQAIYRGPLRDNIGKVVVPAGKTIAIEDPVLDRMNWLLEGIEGDVKGL
jgi:basic membrane protein A and related proteins